MHGWLGRLAGARSAMVIELNDDATVKPALGRAAVAEGGQTAEQIGAALKGHGWHADAYCHYMVLCSSICVLKSYIVVAGPSLLSTAATCTLFFSLSL
jgi:hypothetical protein